MVSAHGDGLCLTIHTVKIAMLCTEGCWTATIMVLTSIKQKSSVYILEDLVCKQYKVWS